MTERSRDLRNGIFCVLVFLACLCLAWPVAQMGFMDDWSYIKTAQVFAETGNVVYNGWAAPMLGWMIPWGALFIKLFGFSFMAVKLSTLPVAVATLLLFHAILRRFEIGPRNAVIGTLTLGLSPLFLPLSASFMTDIPGLFVIVLCLYCCQRAALAGTERAAIGWLAAAAVSNAVGGTARQIAWLGVLVMVPCTGWLLRKRRGVLAASLTLWLAGIGAVFYSLHWFAQQPYRVPVALIPKLPSSVLGGVADWLITTEVMGALVLCLLLVVFPVLVAWLPRFGRKFDHYAALLCVGVLPIAAVELIFRGLGELWPPSVLFIELSMRRNPENDWQLERQHCLLPDPVRVVISLVVIAATIGCISVVRAKGWKAVRSADPQRSRQILWLSAPFCMCYFALVVPMIWRQQAFDRYMLGVMPFAILACLWLYQRYVGPRLPATSLGVLALYAFVAIAGTHDWFAWQRARVIGIHELRAAGVLRTAIQAGVAYDGWTQIEVGGHVNTPGIVVPANAFKPPDRWPDPNNICNYFFGPLVPAIHARYTVGFWPARCYLPSKFASVHYTAWLPPFRRTIEVQRVPGRYGEVTARGSGRGGKE